MEFYKLKKPQLVDECNKRGIPTDGLKREQLVDALNKAENVARRDRDPYVGQIMMTCLGNKRKLVFFIQGVVDDVKKRLGKSRLNILDGFAGSCVVSRKLTYSAENIYTNDLEYYSYLMARCYIGRPTPDQQTTVQNHITMMNYIAENGPFIEGVISRLYAPRDTNNIQEGERCFYTRENALIIDTLRKYITDNVSDELFPYCIVPLLNRASIHSNTTGVFRGFFKKAGIGCFGGEAENDLARIKGTIRLDMPVWNMDTEFKSHCYNMDTNELMDALPSDAEIDLAYFDPPYNQHPYGSNYFMLNLIARNEEPGETSNVSGIPKGWNKSAYNKAQVAAEAMTDLLAKSTARCKYVLISYNNEGIIRGDDWNALLEPYSHKKYEIDYDTFRGCRNLNQRNNKVVETMYLVWRRE